jgi:hypothetical protein
MPLLGFEPTIPVFKRAKTFHVSDRAATVTGSNPTYSYTNQITLEGAYASGAINHENRTQKIASDTT